MSEQIKKSPLEEAKLSYEQIQQFAREQAAVQLEEQVSEKLKRIFEEKLNEDITININGEDVEVKKDGESITSISDAPAEDEKAMDLDSSVAVMEPIGDDTEEFVVSDEDDEIGLDENIEEIIQNQNMEEMNKMKMEQDAAAAPAVPTADATAQVPAQGTTPEVAAPPVEETPDMSELLSKIDTLVNILLQQQGVAETPTPADAGAAAGSEEEFQVIDDEAGAAPAPQAAPPVQEEEIEITDFEKDKNFIDEMEEQMLEIVDEDEVPVEGAPVDETRSLGFASKRTGDRTVKLDTMEKEKGHHAPVTAIKESTKNKAQQESKIDELIKENNSLKSTVKILQTKEKEFEEAFVDLRTQFNEMQLFNGKLALVNKVLMNGGLTTEEKIKICEQFDSVSTYEEASKLFKNIIKENNIKVVGDGKEKIKGTSTNTAKPKSTSEPLYESEEARRAKKLAGITKTENEE